MLCRICENRKPRRFCPGVRAEICAPCCGAEREVTVNCPLDCEYLMEARNHERTVQLEAKDIPNRDVEVTESFLQRNDPLVVFLSVTVMNAALTVPGAVDSDIREALEAAIKTYRTRQSGLIYESRPNNPIAGAIQQHIQAHIQQFQQRLQQQTGMTTLRDADLLGVLVFLQRFELQWANGRPRGRSFVSFLLTRFTSPQAPAESPAITKP